MKQLFLLGVAAVFAAFLFAGGLTTQGGGTVHADPFISNFTYKTTWSGLAPNTAPNLDVQVGLDCPLGSGSCPAAGSSTTPFFDIAVTQYTSNVHTCVTGGAEPAPCTGTKAPLLSTVGTTDFQISTNVVAANLPDNVNPATGSPAQCGAPGTTTLVQTFTIYNGNTSGATTSIVSGKDGPDADSLPDTQADAFGVDGSGNLTVGADGVPDGADGTPDYIKLVLDTALPLLVGRGYGVAQIVPQAAQTDVNFLTLNLGAFGAGYAAITTLGDVRPLAVADPGAGQATVTCTPFTSTVHTLGTSLDSFGTSWTANGVTTTHTSHETPTPIRALTGAPGDQIHYAIAESSLEDVDSDGIPSGIDRCPNPDVGLFPVANALTAASGTTDTDGDGMGDSCDPDPATGNNCPGAAFAGKSAACAADALTPPGPTHETGCAYSNNSTTNFTENGDKKNVKVTCTTAWTPDQDIDGDTFANWADNCPTVYNPDQIDQNSDAIGDACQTTVNTAAGPRPPRPLHDHDTFCDNNTQVGTGSLTPSPVCYNNAAQGTPTNGALAAATQGIVYDSNDDGFPDFLVVPGYSFSDKNSDSDWDGCPDYSEVHNAAIPAASGACGNTFGVASVVGSDSQQCGVGAATCLNPKVSNTNGSNADCLAANMVPTAPGDPATTHCTDGGKDDPNGTVDWLDIATDATQQDIPASSNPNGGDADSDGDGCTNRREALPASPISNGGGRNALNKWDFFDVDTINPGSSVPGKNKAIAIADTIAILQYIGTSSVNPNTLNANGKTYAGDDNNDGISNGFIFDRSPNGALTGPPSGAVAIADAISDLNQIGANCSTP